MTLLVNVQGGTGAGRKRVRTVPTDPWPCKCPVPMLGTPAQLQQNPPWLARCPHCRTRRPA